MDTRYLYKIWFSKNPDVALGIENELRLIRFKHDNPKAIITLVYSSECLNKEALNHLQQFCTKHEINLVDFDKEIESTLIHESDKQIYALAKKEIKRTREKTGGNLGAASDCVRTLVPLIEKYGIYSDLDSHIAFKDKRRFIRVNKAIIFPTSKITVGIKNTSLNNDFLAFAKKMGSEELSLNAIRKARCLQANIIKNYNTRPLEVLYTPRIPGMSLNFVPTMDRVIDYFFENHVQADIFAFRNFLETLSIKTYVACLSRLERVELFGTMRTVSLSESALNNKFAKHIEKITGSYDKEALSKQVDIIKFVLYKASVCLFSGPHILDGLFKTVKPKGVILKQRGFCIEVKPRKPWDSYMKIINQYGLHENGLKNVYFSKNIFNDAQLSTSPSDSPLDQVGTLGDQSWCEIGADKKRSREASMDKAAVCIQHAWHQYKKQYQKAPSKPAAHGRRLSLI